MRSRDEGVVVRSREEFVFGYLDSLIRIHELFDEQTMMGKWLRSWLAGWLAGWRLAGWLAVH